MTHKFDQNYRINHFLSKAGVCSRRAADRLVVQGDVEINGQLARVGQKVGPNDLVYYQGDQVCLAEQTAYFYRLYHKPKGVVTTQAVKANHNLMQALQSKKTAAWPAHFFAVGRLDKDSEGLLLLTNHGALANRLLQQEKVWPKRYLVTVTPKIDSDFVAAMASGVDILGQTTQACRVFKLADNLMQIELTQGLNRQIRRMCQALGYRVHRLIRIEFAGLAIQELPAGEVRRLSVSEQQRLESIVD